MPKRLFNNILFSDHLTYIDQLEPVFTPFGKLAIDIVSSNRKFLNVTNILKIQKALIQKLFSKKKSPVSDSNPKQTKTHYHG